MTVLASLLFIILFRIATGIEQYHHQTSSGDYQVQWKEFAPCPPEKRGTNEIFTDIRLTKRHQGLTEVVGKTILLVPFDDNVTINVDFSILGSNAAWLPIANQFPIPRACTSLINLLQDGWIGYLKNMGMTPKCPISKGIYELKGYDANNLLRNSILPKEFIFGRYKIIAEYLRFRKLVGCVYTIIQVNPFWQRKNKKNEH